MKKVSKKEMSIDDLSVMVAKGFSVIDGRFEIIDKKFEKIDKRFETIEEKFNNLEHRLSQKIDDLNNRIDDFATNWARKDEVRMIDTRVAIIEQKLGLAKKHKISR